MDQDTINTVWLRVAQRFVIECNVAPPHQTVNLTQQLAALFQFARSDGRRSVTRRHHRNLLVGIFLGLWLGALLVEACHSFGGL